MHSTYDILVQAIGFLGLLFFFISFQVKTNKTFFIIQTLGCLTFSLQFALLGALSGAVSLLVNITRNIMLTRYSSRIIRWKGWVFIFSALSFAAALLTWSGPICLLPVIATIAGTIGYWTNNARNIRIANLVLNAPCMLLYDVLVKSWGGALNEAVTLVSIIISIIRFGWKALDGDRIEA